MKKEFDCEYCHGDQRVAKIAKRMGYRPDVAFIRIKELEEAMREFVDENDVHEDVMRMYQKEFKQLLNKPQL